MELQVTLDYNILRKYDVEIELLAQMKEGKGENISAITHSVVAGNIGTGKDTTLASYLNVLEEYDLLDHQQHLLFFAATLYRDFQSSHLEQEELKLAVKQFKKLIALLKIQEQSSLNKVQIKVRGEETQDSATFDTAILVQSLIPAMVDSLIKRIRNYAFNPTLYEVIKDITPSYENYSKALSTINTRNKDVYKSILAIHAFTILDYLNNETALQAEEGALISNPQARFIYSYFEAFNFINDDKIDSPPEDYIRSLLKNYLISKP